jgi:anthranilate phosphoribosyltransferase
MLIHLGTESSGEEESHHRGWYMHRLACGRSLTYTEAAEAMTTVLALTDPRCRSAQLAALLHTVMARRPTVEEVTGIIDAALSIDGHDPRRRPPHPFTGERVIGLAGSGKKGMRTANISTPAALVAASAGAKVVKCASSATSSVAGSADILGILGVRLSADPATTFDVMADCGLGVFPIEQLVPRFDAVYGGLFFAPHVMSLGFPALLVPVVTDALVYGLAHPDVGLAWEVLTRYDVRDVVVVASTHDNLRWVDEVGIAGETWIADAQEGRGRTARLDIARLVGIDPGPLDHLRPGATPHEQARLTVSVLAGTAPRGLRDMVAVNAATLLVVAGICPTLAQAFEVAGDRLDGGAALDCLRRLVHSSGGVDDGRVRAWATAC